MKLWKILVLLILVPIVGCAYLGGNKDSDELTISTTSNDTIAKTESNALTGTSNFTFEDKEYLAEWFSCILDPQKPTVLLLHDSDTTLKKETFCDSFSAQSFLNNSYNVVSTNAPGVGKSTGTNDFSGPLTIANIRAGTKASQEANKLASPPIGAWGYSSGVIAATFYAKSAATKLSFLILGGGIYDMEETYDKTKSITFKLKLGTLKSSSDDFFETRSISYDVSNLPKNISIYHGEKDTFVMPSQAKDFYDSLVSSEYRASLEVLKNIGHKINDNTHFKILQVMIHPIK